MSCLLWLGFMRISSGRRALEARFSHSLRGFKHAPHKWGLSMQPRLPGRGRIIRIVLEQIAG